jgi:hypothetical protein
MQDGATGGIAQQPPADAGESQTMKLQTVEIDGKTYAQVQDGKPVYLDDAGKEVAFDAPGTVQTISRLNGEAMTHRQAKEAAEAKVKAFEGITDPAAARKALETVAGLDAKKLIDAGEIERVKSEISGSFQAQIEELTGKLKARDQQVYDLNVGHAFAGSKFIADKVAVPPHLLKATYGGNFKEEDGKLVAYDGNGQKIYSRSNPGELASFDEALEMIVNADPFKDHILKGTGAAGSGAKPGEGGPGAAKTYTRTEFDKLTPAAAAAAAKDVREGKASIVDA